MAKQETFATIFKKVSGGCKFEAEKYCVLVLEVVSKMGRVSAFCKAALISENTFYDWLRKYPIFNECYQIAKMLAYEQWEKDGENNLGNDDFNWKYWEKIGNMRFNAGRQDKVYLNIDPDADPYTQYRQLIRQTGHGAFSAVEIKQIMESVNVGTRVYETFQLQQEVDKMKSDLIKMNQNHGNNIVPITEIKKTN